MTNAVIIQARMTSKRFPGKVMYPLADKPVLQRVIERVKMIPNIDRIIVAFPDDPISQPINDLALDHGVSVYAGPERDVLRRYWEAAVYYGITEPRDTIMRITADCPFIDPLLCAEVLECMIHPTKMEMKFDYVSNSFPDRTFPKGLDCEVFTYECLEAAEVKVHHWPQPTEGSILLDIWSYPREHVTPWMQQTDGIIRACVESEGRMSPLFDWCVDEITDITRLEPVAGSRDQMLTDPAYLQKLAAYKDEPSEYPEIGSDEDLPN
jgi:spore coat polysaccharide biosynthesis protein SpsF (cytidylyltransferase family)